MQPFERCVDIGEPALDVPALACDSGVERAAVRNARPIDVQDAEILEDRQRPIEKRARPGNPHPDHADDHAGSPDGATDLADCPASQFVDTTLGEARNRGERVLMGGLNRRERLFVNQPF